jgi:uncharacterized repeat protein (TIGR01451 family)
MKSPSVPSNGSPAVTAATSLRRLLTRRPRLSARLAALGLCLGIAVAGGAAAFVLPASSAAEETVQTFAADCTTAQTIFELGDTVCAKVTGATANQRRFLWADPVPLGVQVTGITAGTQTDSFAIPEDPTTDIAGMTVDNRGQWRVNSIDNSDGSARATAYFTVRDPANAVADVSLTNIVRVGASGVAPGTNAVFFLYVRNEGPDTAQGVAVTDAIPSGTTFVTASQDSGPAFTCAHPNAGDTTGTSNCTIAGLAPGDSATFTLVYEVEPGLTDGTVITNAASIATTTNERDADNNSLSAETKVSTPACTINVPGDITVNNTLGQGGAVVTYADPTSSGTCGSVSCAPASGSFFPVGTNPVVCTSSNAGTSDSFFVIVNDTENPTITCPANIAANENPSGSGSAVVNFPPPAAADNGDFEVSTSHQSGEAFPIGTTTVTATVTDNSQNTATCQFNVVVSPSACTLGCPASVVVSEDAPGSGTAVVNYADPTTAGTCGTVTYSHDSGSTFSLGTTSVTATDSATGTTCSFNVTVNAGTDTTAPVITCPAPITQAAAPGSCSANVSPGTATATDDKPGVTVQGTRSDGAALNAPYPAGTVAINWTALDAAGNEASCTQLVTVTDSAGPEFTAPASSTETVNASCDLVAVPDFTAGLVVSDACSPLAEVTVTQSPAPGSSVGVGAHTIIITATDGSNNSTTTNTTTFTVNDTTPPTLTLNGDAEMTLQCGTTFVDPGATATDACVANLTVTVTGSVNTNTPGDYTLNYSVTDGSNVATATRTVHVVDTTAPTLTLNGDASVTVECHTSYADAGASVADACDGNIPVNTAGSVNTDVPGTYTLTYTASDDAGNAATPVTRTVHVVDTTKPTVAINGAAVMTLECTSGFTDPGAKATDACAGDLTGSIVVSGSVNTSVVGTYTLTYSVSDPSGNIAIPATRTVNVVDTTAPVISCPADIVVSLPLNSTATSRTVTFPAPTATDTCGGASVATSHASGSVFNVGATTVTATATDDHGNTSTCTFKVTVLYNFTGFFQPVDNLPTLNQVNAGRAIPVKFSLSGNKGLNIFAPDSPASAQFTCGANDPVVDIEQTVEADANSISYSGGSDQYNFVWKTDKAWANTCRQLVVVLNDGSTHRANFKFK